jgi:hypothetical protein
LKRIILLTTVGAVVVAVLVASALSVGAQNIGQSPGQYAEQSPGGTAGQQPATGQTAVCAPWSEEWDLSEGWWYFQLYRWCYDPSSSDPSLEESWYRELGDWGWWNEANLCPEKGTCTITPGGVRMITGPS